jgi:hypothetical protein
LLSDGSPSARALLESSLRAIARELIRCNLKKAENEFIGESEGGLDKDKSSFRRTSGDNFQFMKLAGTCPLRPVFPGGDPFEGAREERP